MNELEKLKRLLHHWQHHNDEHAEVYKQWADKVISLGNKELSKILTDLYNETKKLNRLFEDALKMID